MFKQISKIVSHGLPALLIAGVSVTAYGQSFPGFTTGNIVVSRSVYAGSAASLPVGQPLPPVCPSTATCGTKSASDSGAYPSINSANNVFNNDLPDASFGITSPLFLDQLSPAGTLVNTLTIPTSLVTTSFSSKSEVALNLSADGTAITFMAYVAPANTIDVSNSNTPEAYDPTNPAGGSYYRSVVQVGSNGAIQVTPTNSYSGNNGRAAALANGLYYMAGNANNGSGTPANIIGTAGVQIATPGQSLATPAVQAAGNFSISQVMNPATGLPYAPDKAGKDHNFRGLTIFNNTLYVTKGSGGNGINTVYRVGDKGSLPTLANAASAALTILPGFPTTLAKNAGAANPFGLFFANATTLYVADEGDGTAANAATSKIAGIGKWVLTNGVWTQVYVLQNGLNLGQQYSIANYPTSLNPSTDGIRNIAGRVNADGTVTLWGITSTISSNGDQGADPNKLVSITDVVASSDPKVAAGEQFTTLRTANAGEILRGVALAPTAGATPAVNVPLILSASNPSAVAIAPSSLAVAAGQNFATTTITPSSPFPTTVAATSVSITDALGVVTAAPLLFVSPTQILFLVPAAVAPGTAQITVTNGTAGQTAANVEISSVAPGLLTLNGTGLAAAQVVQVAASGAQLAQQIYSANSSGAIVPNPIALGGGNSTYLVLFGTGIAGAGTALTSATINGVNAPVIYAGSAGTDTGLDQVNLLIPTTLAGKGNVNVQLTVEGIAANPVQITVQ
ncbi:MAG: hypothetical protein M3N93_09425 [Acidobacteriota bacterium]|nr:hypothetical protein [Acidobacteriota bacterium]